jgi:hypothetical protein
MQGGVGEGSISCKSGNSSNDSGSEVQSLEELLSPLSANVTRFSVVSCDDVAADCSESGSLNVAVTVVVADNCCEFLQPPCDDKSETELLFVSGSQLKWFWSNVFKSLLLFTELLQF